MNTCHLAKRIIALCATIFAFTSCGGAASTGPQTSDEPGQTSSGGEISDFALKDVDGRTHALSDYLGDKVIVLSFWATWCEPCKKEMTGLQKLYEEHADKGLIILSISMDEPEYQGEVRPFVKQRGFTFPVLLDTESLVTNQFNPRRSAPYNMIISRQQKTVWSHEGYVPGDEQKLEAAILDALDLLKP
ncbi:MAG: TlpA family protein disulfide reductase [Deltaproteobacteria bacterium]|nr:TlpA family protein disulfide reductase [Deltaproteobacteria bacterium]